MKSKFLTPSTFNLYKIIFGFVLFAPLFLVAQIKPLEGSVRQYNNRPTIFINDQPVSPQFYSLTHAYGGRWSWEEVPSRNLKNFYNIGYRLFQVDLYFQDIWFKDKTELQMEKALHQIRGVLDVCPGAAIVMRIHVNAPYWWNEDNRQECTEYADAPVDIRSYGPPNDVENGDIDHPLRASLASFKWRTEASEKLVEFCQRLSATEEGNAIIGLHVSCGVFGEWHYWGFPDHDPDIGIAMTNYFRDWLRKKYNSDASLQNAWKDKNATFNTLHVPGKRERDTTRDGVFRDPQTERKVIDYYECQQYVVAEDVLHFCKLVKKSWPRPLIVGVFYNYFFMTFSRQAVGGHLQNEMILNSPDIDYLSAPQSYWGPARKIGGSGQSRGLVESAMLHKKLWLDEMDQNSYKGGPNATFATTKEQDIAIIRRNLAQAITRGVGYWFYDFGPLRNSGWWDDTTLLNDIKKQRKILDDYYQRPFERKAEVLFVYSNQIFYHIKTKLTPVTSYAILDQQSADAFQSGALIDQVYMEDLRKLDLKKYKTIVFSNVFYLKDVERKFIKEKVAKEGRHIVWNYMPGYTNGKVNNLKFIKEVTGIDIEPAREKGNVAIITKHTDYPLAKIEESATAITPLIKITDKTAQVLGINDKTNEVMVVKKTFSDHTVWYSAYLFNNPEVFRKIFQTSGAHIYGDGNDIFYEGGILLMIHSKTGGNKKIRLQNGNEIDLNLKPETTIYLDSDTGKILLP